MGILMETTEVNLGTASHRGRRRAQAEMFGAMGNPSEFFAETVHTIAIKTRETEFGSIIEPVPITLKTYKHFQTAHVQSLNGYGYPQQFVTTLSSIPPAPQILEVESPSTSSLTPSPIKQEAKETQKITRPPPKKKWIKEYLEEEPKSPVSVRVVPGSATTRNGLVRAVSPAPLSSVPPPAEPAPAPAVPPSTLFLDFVKEHSRPRSTSNSHGPPQIPSPPSVGSNGSGSGSNGSSCSNGTPRAGTREVHNKLEKNRRAHLKECFELLKRQLPAASEDKKTSNLSILGSAIRYIQVLRRKERECEHEMERLARDKIAAQQRLAALKREVSVLSTAVRPRSIGVADILDEKETEEVRDKHVNGQVLGIPISITSSSPPRPTRTEASSSPPRSMNLSSKLRTLPIQITPATSQVVRTSYGARHNTLTLTTLAPADSSAQNGQPLETNNLSTLVHPAQIHLPLSQVVGSGGLVVGPAALQLLSTSGGLRVLQTPVHANGLTTGDNHRILTTAENHRIVTTGENHRIVTTGENHRIITTGDNHRIPKENGIVSPPPISTEGVVVSGLTPLVVSQPGGHLLHRHTLAHKMVETQVVNGSMAPLTVNAQYLSATTIVKPMVVVSGAPSTHTSPT